MKLAHQEDVLAHALQSLHGLENDLEHAAMAAADRASSDHLRAALRKCARTSTVRIARIRVLWESLEESSDALGGAGPGARAHAMQAISSQSRAEAVDLVIIADARRVLAAAQSLYADTAVLAMRWNMSDISRELGISLSQVAQLLTTLEDIDGSIAASLDSRSAHAAPDLRLRTPE